MKNGISHTPDMLERFKKTLTPKNKEEIMHKVKITSKNAGLGWAEAISEMLGNQKG